MRNRRFFSTLFSILPAVLMLLPAGVAGADDESGPQCFQVHAQIEAQVVGEDCESPVGLCTEGEVRGLLGFLGGETRFVAQGLGGGAVGEESIVTPPVEPATTWSYRGDLRMRTFLGDLLLEDVGVLDTVRSTFTETDRVVGGTGLFRDATGDLFIYGTTTADGQGFDGTIRGTLCLPRS